MLPRRKHPALALGQAIKAPLRFVLGGVLLALSGGFAAGQDTGDDFQVAVQGRVLLMELAGHAVTIPGPLWSPGETVDVERSQVRFDRIEPGVEQLILMPEEESLVTWTRMSGVLAVDRPGYSGALHVASVLEPLQQSCVRDQTGISRIDPPVENGMPALVLVCGRYLPTAEGRPRNCTGGILVAVVVESPRGAMKVYDEWCTGAFDLADRSSWPVPDTELLAIAKELQQVVRFVPLE